MDHKKLAREKIVVHQQIGAWKERKQSWSPHQQVVGSPRLRLRSVMIAVFGAQMAPEL